MAVNFRPEFKITGDRQVSQKLANILERFPQVAGEALVAELEIDRDEVEERTPIKTGLLRSTIRVDGPHVNGKQVRASIQAGGPETPYALEVHENLDIFHPHGQAKFVESVHNESSPHMTARIGRRIDLKDLVG
jgi:hypothetical protein